MSEEISSTAQKPFRDRGFGGPLLDGESSYYDSRCQAKNLCSEHSRVP